MDIEVDALDLALYLKRDGKEYAKNVTEFLREVGLSIVDTSSLEHRSRGTRDWLIREGFIPRIVYQYPEPFRNPIDVADYTPTVLDLAAAFSEIENFELVQWNVTFNPETKERLTFNGPYDAFLLDFASGAYTSVAYIDTDQANRMLTLLQEDVVKAHEDLQRSTQTPVAELHAKMITRAQKQRVMATSDALPTRKWSEFYTSISNDVKRTWYSQSDQRTIVEVLAEYKSWVKKWSSTHANELITFNIPYDALQSDDHRAILALSAWMIPHTLDYGWPESTMSTDYSAFFAENTSHAMLATIQSNDSLITGKPLKKTVSFA